MAAKCAILAAHLLLARLVVLASPQVLTSAAFATECQQCLVHLQTAVKFVGHMAF